MAISTLSKLSVPTDGAGSNQTLLMPKLQYRFRVFLNNFGVTNGDVLELTKEVIDVTRPTVSFEQITLDAYNSRVYLAGKHTWEPITLNLRDDASQNVQRLVGEQMQKQYDFYEQASARSGIDYKFNMKIEILDGGNGEFNPNELETFHLAGVYIENANYNNLAYSAGAEPATVTLSLRYDNAIQFYQGERVGIGSALGRITDSAVSTGGG